MDEIHLLAQYLNKAMAQAETSYFSPWPESNAKPLNLGSPRPARHILIRGLASYPLPNGPPTVVADVGFVAEGGMFLAGYSSVPMAYSEITKMLYNDFKPAGKCVLISNEMYPCIQNKSQR